MKITLSAALLFALVTPVMAGENDVTLTPGKFSTDVGKRAIQFLIAKNNGSETISMLRVECGFLKGAELVATGTETSLNVATGQSVYLQVIANHPASIGADHTDCRVVGAVPTPADLAKALQEAVKTMPDLRPPPGGEYNPNFAICGKAKCP
jgi:hypothetical protein